MEERIEQLNCVAVFDGVILVVFVIPLVVSHCLNPVGIEGVSFYDVQDLYFVVRSFYVVHGTLLHLECHIIVVLCVTSEPDGREMTPTKLLHYDVPVNQSFTDVHGMVSTNFVVRDTFVLAGITICVQLTLTDLVFESSEPAPITVFCSFTISWLSLLAILIIFVFLLLFLVSLPSLPAFFLFLCDIFHVLFLGRRLTGAVLQASHLVWIVFTSVSEVRLSQLLFLLCACSCGSDRILGRRFWGPGFLTFSFLSFCQFGRVQCGNFETWFLTFHLLI